jgi:Holliday junction resolvasome RuvABC ATP-dependent DNA helicase subunit
MGFIIFGIMLIGLSLYLNAKAPLKPYNPPRRRGAVVDYSFGRTQLYGSLAMVPEAYDTAALALLGPAVYDATVERALTTAQAVAAEVSTTPMQYASVVTQAGPQPVFFKEGEPTTLSEYEGQRHVVEYLEAVIDGTPKDRIVPREHQLFLGPPGLGKTLLTKCFVNSLNKRNERLGLPQIYFQEEFPADLPDLKSLDRAIRKASERPSVLFIDEIHDLKSEGHALKLYLLLEEGRYKFEGEAFPIELPNIMLVGATTDYGALHQALQRRFNRHALMPLTKEQITDIVSQGREMPITSEAALALVDRTHFSGAPWEALQLYRQALQFARQRQATHVDTLDVERVFDSQQIDTLGLRWMDRSVLRALLGMPRFRNAKGGTKEFVCYAAAEKDTTQLAQVDPGEYRETIKPRLMARGLLQIRATYGQALTDKAVELYGWLVNPS